MLLQKVLFIASVLAGVMAAPNPLKGSGSKVATKSTVMPAYYQPEVSFGEDSNSIAQSPKPLDSAALEKIALNHILSKVSGLDASGLTVSDR